MEVYAGMEVRGVESPHAHREVVARRTLRTKAPKLDADKCNPNERLRQLLNQEVEEYLRYAGKSARCELCPFREFYRPCRVKGRVCNYHTEESSWCATGSNQLRVCIALYDNDMMSSKKIASSSPNYLKRSALIIRDGVLLHSPVVEEALSPSNLIGRDIRVIHFRRGPELRHIDFAIQEACSFRRLGFNYYDATFYNSVYTLALTNQGRADRIKDEMSILCENELASLLPQFIHVWESILFDIFYSAAGEEELSRLLEICCDNGEFEYITIDCTVKPTLPLLGQVNHNKRLAKKKKQAVPYAEQYHAVLIVRGASGSALMVEPMFSENILASAALYNQRFTKVQRESVKFMASDKTSGLLVSTMRMVFPSLVGCALDPVHLAMATEKATWERKNQISSRLRAVLSKFSPLVGGRAGDGPFYEGGVASPSLEESQMRKSIISGGMVKKRAVDLLKNLEPWKGFETRAQFCAYLSALTAAYPDLSKKRARLEEHTTAPTISMRTRSD